MKGLGFRALGMSLFFLLTFASARGQDSHPIQKAVTTPQLAFEKPRRFVADKSLARVGLNDGTFRIVQKPRFREVADKKFWLVAAGTYAASVYRVEGFVHCREMPSCEVYGYELRRRPAQYAFAFSLNTVMLGAMYYWKKADMVNERAGRKPRLRWWMPAVGWTVTNMGLGTRSWLINEPIDPD